jgi:hypothetical protein
MSRLYPNLAAKFGPGPARGDPPPFASSPLADRCLIGRAPASGRTGGEGSQRRRREPSPGGSAGVARGFSHPYAPRVSAATTRSRDGIPVSPYTRQPIA